MKNKIFTLCLMTAILLQACQSDDISDNNTITDPKSKVVLNSNSAELSSRMDHSNSGVISLKTSNLTSRVETQGTDNFPMSLLAEVNPPSYEGKKLTATHVDVKNNYVYVSYNTQGETYLG